VVSLIHSGAFGGPHNQAICLAPELAARGCELIVVLPDEPGDAAPRMRAAGIDVVQMPLIRPRRHLRYLPGLAFRYARQIRQLARRLRDWEADIVEIHGLTNIDGAIAARMAGCALVWQLIDTRPPMSLRRLLMPVVTRLADVVMTTGVAVAQEYPRCLDLGERLVPYVPPVAPFEPVEPSTRQALRRRYGAIESDVLLVAVGNQNPQKGHDILLRAAARLCEMRPAVRVLIRGAQQPGHESYARELQRLSLAGPAGRLSVAELEPGVAITDLMGAADVFVLSAKRRSEGIPTVVLEALAAGTPAVVADVGAVREVVPPSVGVVVKPENEGALLDALISLIDDEDRRRAMRHRAPTASATAASPRVFGEAEWKAFVLAMHHSQVRAARRRVSAR
jgi:glycosyltransferase involved in cell wall biosynthesis